MPSLPPLDIKTNTNHAPHVLILGAGASLAAFPDGDANGRVPPLMRNLAHVTGLQPLLEDRGVAGPFDDFESLYDDLALSLGDAAFLAQIEERIRQYFQELRIPDQATLYDYLVLSMRKKDLIATFNWDPFLAHAYRRNAHLRNLPKLAFLHGNVEIGACHKHRKSGFVSQRCSACDRPFAPSRLLYPVKHKDYNADPFIKGEWEMLRHFLSHAYYVTILGYSAPTTDVEAKKLMLDEWKGNPTMRLAEIDIVDIRPEGELEETWKDFLYKRHYGIYTDVFNTMLLRHPRRSCDAFAMATLQNEPWEENPVPKTETLADLQEWVKPLIAEEDAGRLSGKPCSPSRPH